MEAVVPDLAVRYSGGIRPLGELVARLQAVGLEPVLLPGAIDGVTLGISTGSTRRGTLALVEATLIDWGLDRSDATACVVPIVPSEVDRSTVIPASIVDPSTLGGRLDMARTRGRILAATSAELAARSASTLGAHAAYCVEIAADSSHPLAGEAARHAERARAAQALCEWTGIEVAELAAKTSVGTGRGRRTTP